MSEASTRDDDDDDFGVVATCWIPLAWRYLPEIAWTPERRDAAARTNLKHLRAILDKETRESPPQEIALIESICLEILRCVKSLPTSRSAVLSSGTVEWVLGDTERCPDVGDSGLVTMFLDPALPYEVEFFASVTEVEVDDRGASHVRARLANRPESVQDVYQQLMFIMYRRNLPSVAEK